MSCSFYGCYTSWTICVGIVSAVALGLIVGIYHVHSSDKCHVDRFGLSYDLYDLDIFVLSITVFNAFIQGFGYLNTHTFERSGRRRIIICLQCLLFATQILGIYSMIYKFHKNGECLTFLKKTQNGKIMLISFESSVIVFGINIILLIFGLSIMRCGKQKHKYEII